MYEFEKEGTKNRRRTKKCGQYQKDCLFILCLLVKKKYILVRVLWRNRTDRIKLYISKGDLLEELTGCALSSPVIAASD